MKKMIYMTLLTAAGMMLLTGCHMKEPEKIDLSSIHTTAAETMADTTAKEKETISSAETEAIQIDTSASSSTGTSSIKSELKTYQNGSISIQYPQVTNLSDSSKQAQINELLKTNALSILQAYEVDEATDTVSITCKVKASDKKRLTAIYTGTAMATGGAHPTNLFYTNTVDMNQCTNIGFNTYADPYTMAGYVLSDDCGLSAEVKAEIKASYTLEDYTKIFEHADFPYTGTFPESFSYEELGTIYFSIPVSHALGDYVIVKYVPETK